MPGDETPIHQRISALLDSALAYHQAGDVVAAGARYAEILELDPEHYDALRLRGVAALQSGDFENATRLLDLAIDARPSAAEAWCNLATARQMAGDLSGASAALREGLQRDPSLAGAHNNLGNLLVQTGRNREAVEAYRDAARLAPGDSEVRANLAAVLHSLGELEEAEREARRAVETTPDLAQAYAVHATVLHTAGDPEAASARYARAAELEPANADWLYGLGSSLDDLGRWSDALDAHRRALELDPGHTRALSQALFLARRLCRWDEADALGAVFHRLLGIGADGLSPFVFLAEESSARDQRRCAELWASRIEGEVAGTADRPMFSRRPGTRDRLTVGFVSNGFGAHPTGALSVEAFEHLADSSLRLIAYATTPSDGSPLRLRLERAFSEFRDVSTSHWSRIAERVYADEVDILVDMRGYGAGAVTEVFAARPAPVQISWLAYPGTMGASFIDHLIADAFVAPEDRGGWFSERVIRLPRCYQPVDTRREIDTRIPGRAECGLPADGLVLCCFNNSYKISRGVFGIWMETLRDHEDAVLWLLDVNPDSDLKDILLREAEASSVPAERIVFMPKLPHAEYLARYRLADLFVDTYPYNAHTTASDALFAGCPILTAAGETFASRVAGSILTTAGMDALVTDSLDAYRDRLRCLAGDRDELRALREGLVDLREISPLFDMAGFAESLETALRSAWEEACA